jgi:hypothetical protein
MNQTGNPIVVVLFRVPIEILEVRCSRHGYLSVFDVQFTLAARPLVSLAILFRSFEFRARRLLALLHETMAAHHDSTLVIEPKDPKSPLNKLPKTVPKLMGYVRVPGRSYFGNPLQQAQHPAAILGEIVLPPCEKL